MQYDASGGAASRGRLIFLMGPSGSGKDSLIEAARQRLIAHGIEIARRVITRSAEAKGEDALGVSVERFETMREAGAFALDWQANGLSYGIPVQLDAWLAAGRSVLVNGSRAYLTNARQRYPDLVAVGLTVSQQALRQRLLARGGRATKRSSSAWPATSGCRPMIPACMSWTTLLLWSARSRRCLHCCAAKA